MKETEFGYIKWIQKRLKYSPDVLIGSGDDVAVFKVKKNSQITVTTDTIVEGVDFQLNKAAPEQVGYKSVAVSISDLAAMGGGFEHIYAVITLSIKKVLANTKFTRPLFAGVNRACQKYQIQLIGGDISSTSGPLTITSTLFGVGQKVTPVLRSGAQFGDAILVTGKLGGSILGRHLSFTPRLKERNTPSLPGSPFLPGDSFWSGPTTTLPSTSPTSRSCM